MLKECPRVLQARLANDVLARLLFLLGSPRHSCKQEQK